VADGMTEGVMGITVGQGRGGPAEILLLHSAPWWNSLLSVTKNGRSELGTRESAVHHQLDRVDV
jgi:hypothetical protein